MKKPLLLLTLLIINFELYTQIQVSNFTYNSVQNSDPISLLEFNGKIIFSAVTDGYGRELWSTDGTSSNINLVKDIQLGENDGLTTIYSATLNNELYFISKSGDIWKTDGTEIGSSLVTNTGKVSGITTVGNHLFFTKKTDDTTLQIWKTDGTDSGTILVKDNIPAWNSIKFQGSVNNVFIFTVQVPSTNNTKVWRSDGTDSGTYALTGELDGNGSTGNTSDLSQFIKYKNKLYFITRYFLYETDGTINGTVNITNVWNAQNNLVSFADVIELNDQMYFSFFSKDLKKLSIYKSDGTFNGTSEIYTTTSSNYFYPSYLNKHNNNLIFSSVNPQKGTSLFYLDTNTNLVSEIIEIDKQLQSPSFFLGPYSALSLDKIDNKLFFVSSPNGNFHKKGWILNISSLTLKPFEELDDLIHQIFGKKIIYNNELYYSKNYQLWKFDTNTLKVNSLEKNQQTQVFPNPSSKLIYFNNQDDIYQIKIYDLSGRLVLEKKQLKNNNINLENLSSGGYLIKILGKNGSVTYKKILKN